MTLSPRKFKNEILASLSRRDLALVEPSLEKIRLPVNTALEQPNEPIKVAYFLENGLASVTASNKARSLQVGMIGKEGMTGGPIILRQDASAQGICIQVAAYGHALSASALRSAMNESRSLEDRLMRWAYSFQNQTLHAAVSGGTASLEERVARWLLMANDRLTGDGVAITHHCLASSLGVRRAGVSVALNRFQKLNMITQFKEHIVIVDRVRLKKFANGTYQKSEN